MPEKQFGLGVIVCIFNKDFSKILLVKRNAEKREKHGADWGNVGGKMEPGEMSKDAALREAKEEIGIDIEPKKLNLVEVLEKPDLHPLWHGAYFVYSACLDENCKLCVNEESDECRWFPINKLPDKMLDSKEFILEILKKAKSKS